MKLATTTADFGDYDICESIKHICEAGFRYIDLSLNVTEKCSKLFKNNFECELSRIADAAQKYDAKFVQAHAPTINCFEKGRFDEAVFKTVRSIEICGKLGIPNIVVHAGWDRDITSKAEWFEKNKNFYSKMFLAQEEHKVNVLCENGVNLPFVPVPAENMKNGFSIITGAEMREFVKYVNHPYFHACWDIGHANVNFGGSHYKEITDLGDELYAVHFHDNDGTHDYHLVPFMGVVNADEIMHALIDIGFKGPLTFEAVTTLRSKDFWLGNRRDFYKDNRLAEPPLKIRKKMEEFLYTVGETILKSYGIFEG